MGVTEDKKEIYRIVFQFEQSEIIAPGCSVLDWANNVKEGESG